MIQANKLKPDEGVSEGLISRRGKGGRLQGGMGPNGGAAGEAQGLKPLGAVNESVSRGAYRVGVWGMGRKGGWAARGDEA